MRNIPPEALAPFVYNAIGCPIPDVRLSPIIAALGMAILIALVALSASSPPPQNSAGPNADGVGVIRFDAISQAPT